MRSEETDTLSCGRRVQRTSAFNRLFDLHAAKMMDILYQRLRDEPEDAEELWVDVWKTVHVKIEEGYDQGKEDSWVWSILWQKLRQYYRDAARRRQTQRRLHEELLADARQRQWCDSLRTALHAADEDVVGILSALPRERHADVLLGQVRDLVEEEVVQALSALPTDQVSAFLLSKHHEVETEEVLGLTGWSRDNYYQLVHRAKTKMQELLVESGY